VVSYLINPDYAEAWARLLVERSYAVPKGDPVRYLAGQPMGAYSSWASMALTHHFIIHWAAKSVGIKSFRNYAILGDDVVIADKAVAESYRGILFDLDMPISSAKSHICEDVSFEFAKRWFIKGQEVTPFSIGGLGSVWNRYYLLHNFLTNQASHGWSLTLENALHMIRALYRLKRAPPRRIKEVVLKYSVFHYLAKLKPFLSGLAPSVDVQDIFGLFNALSISGVDLSSLRGFQALPDLVKTMIRRVKRDIVKRDLDKFQQFLPKALTKAQG